MSDPRDEWFGGVQYFLEAAIKEAPDETCRLLAERLLQETYDFTDDDSVQCDACGEMKPRDEIAKVTAYGIETSACAKCRGDG